jgi:hypothetical protein
MILINGTPSAPLGPLTMHSPKSLSREEKDRPNLDICMAASSKLNRATLGLRGPRFVKAGRTSALTNNKRTMRIPKWANSL